MFSRPLTIAVTPVELASELSPLAGDYDFVDDVPSRFKCAICSDLLKNPHLTECCGQHYCRSCLTRWLAKRFPRSCPQCRAHRVVHILDKSLVREIDELQVRCVNKGKGCKWVGEKGTLSSHLRSNSHGCEYMEVTCSFGSCGLKMERRQLKTHMEKECIYRPYRCRYCFYKDTFKAITIGDTLSQSHHDTCQYYPVHCPNKCKAGHMQRKKLPAHRSECPLEKIPCPFVETGCKQSSLLRKDLDSHLEKDIQYHMLGLLKSHRELKEKYNKLAESRRRVGI